MSDLLRPLLQTIETVRDRINSARSAGGWNEAQTRASLIDPILTALGWDVADPALVRHEVKSSDGFADYTLLKGEDHPAAIVEAKALGALLDIKEVGQTTNYANHRGAPYAALTNGDRWILYDVFKEARLEDRLLLDTAVSSAEPHATALELLKLWRHRISTTRRRPEPRPELPPAVPKSGRVAPTSPPRAGWVPFDNVGPSDEFPPAAIRFDDGDEWRCSEAWYSIVEGAIVCLYRREELTEADMPALSDKKGQPVIHLESEAARMNNPKPARGTPFVFSGHGNADMHLKRFRRLMETYGHSGTSVFAKPRK